MLLTIAGVIIVLWIIGLLAHIAGGFVNILLIAAIVMVVAHFLGYRSNRT